MKRRSVAKQEITCPECGNTQMEYAEATSANCKACGAYIQLKERKKAIKIRLMRSLRNDVKCLDCGHIQAVPSDVHSWQCENCGSHLDFNTHRIDGRHTAKIVTYGGIIIGPRGLFHGARGEADWIRVAGISVGVLVAWTQLTVDGHARLRAQASAQHLEVEPEASLETDHPLEFKTAYIDGRVKGKQLLVTEELHVGPTGEVFVDTLQFAKLTVEPGGKLRGRAISMGLEK